MTPPESTEPEFISVGEEEFLRDYSPLPSPTGETDWTYDQIKGKPTQHVWSVVETGDADHDAIYAVPGWHTVNVLGYQLTTKAWPHENMEALLHLFENDTNDTEENDA